jgi:hypothetical protein
VRPKTSANMSRVFFIFAYLPMGQFFIRIVTDVLQTQKAGINRRPRTEAKRRDGRRRVKPTPADTNRAVLLAVATLSGFGT